MNLNAKSTSMARRAEKKTKVIWTKDLHKKFLEAIEKLGIDNAVPKKIVELMEVDGLTRDHVASHLQKYRILSKKIANASYCVQTASEISLLESSMTNGTSLSKSPLMLHEEQMNWSSYSTMHAVNPPILDTSRSYFPVLEASNFNATFPSELTHCGSLPNKGCSMQVMTNNLDAHINFFDDGSMMVNMSNSSNSGFVQNLDGWLYDYGGCSTEVQSYNTFERGSSGGWPNPNGLERDCFNQSEFVEIDSVLGACSNNVHENRFGEDDLILNEDDIAFLLSYADEINLSVNLGPPDQRMDERFMEPVWSPEPDANEMILEGVILNSYVQA